MRALRTLTSAAIVAALAVVASCSDTDTPRARPTATATEPRAATATPTPLAADPVIVAAGDIACGTNTPGGTPCKQAQVATVIGTVAPDAVLTLGDNQYEDGTLADYNAFYGPTWGQYKSITYPSVGNHEYQTPNATGYFDYFNGVGVANGRAGQRGKGYYSYDLGTWHLIALNSNCGSVGGCGVGSPQEVWLRADLAAHPTTCTLAYWHHPLYSSGVHGNDASTQALWAALMAYDADVVLTGHDHNYERFAPQNATGGADAVHGLREFVVGTGGKEQRTLGTTKANSQLRANNSLGVLKLTLHPSSYDWQFVPIPGNTLNDAGTTACHGTTTNQPPTASITSPANPSSFVQGASVSFAGTGNDPETGALTGSALVWTSNLDGQIGTGTSFSTTSLSVGQHTITLTAKDPQNATGSATITVTITSGGGTNQPPVASFTINCPTLQCFADASGSTDDHGIVSYAWVWGGGKSKTVTTPNTSTTYAAAGTYTVTLTVTDAGGLTGTTSKQVTVPTPQGNQPPTASITLPTNGTSVVQGTSVSFSGSGNDPETGALTGAALVWTSNIDGQIGTGTSFSTTTLSVGTHTITLTATDPQNATGTATRTITITSGGGTNQPPVANFTWTCVGFNPHQCQFDGGSSTDDKGVVSYAWTWGNGTGETKTVPITKKTYLAAGTYNVTLTVTDAGGLTSSITKSVAVP